MSHWEPYRQKEASLREIELRIASASESAPDIALRFEQASLLTQLGRPEEAKRVYLEILAADPDQFVALNNLGNLLHESGHRTAALLAYRQAATRHPDNPTGHLNLAHALYAADKLDEAVGSYREVLRLKPDHPGAHQGLSYLLMDLGEEEAAGEHRRKGFGSQPMTTFPYRGGKEPVRILLLASPRGGNAPLERFLDNRLFLVTQIVPDFFAPSMSLPPHHLVVNSIGDADLCGPSLEAAAGLLSRTVAPALNLPERIEPTGRASNARRLGILDGVTTARTVLLPREALAGADGPARVERAGFSFPVLLRTPGFHGGTHFLRVENPGEMARVVAGLPGRELAVLQHLDARSGDGLIRKYRVMMIDGVLYPLHAAVSRDWKVHYFSAEMADSPEHRAEDEAFLGDMPGVLGPQAVAALERVRILLGLDYAGADFSLGPGGGILLFEANATMTVPRPDRGAQWDYRRAPVQRIGDAVRNMLLSRARTLFTP